MKPIDYNHLAEKAIEAKKFAHAPYSNFHVGAALLTESNEIYTGCNVENSSFGLTICAERVAVFKAYSDGIRKFKAIAVASDDQNFCPPCGACRQVLMDLCGDIDFVMVDGKMNLKVFKLSELLPFAFGDENLKSK
ncbi:MAG: cytidine deaminase [Ignavibacteria bacterium]|nr:cytidine deaminase [Ignavibacteria bacterium]